MDINLVDVVSIFIGLTGVFYALYENRSKAALKRHLRSQSWHLYTKAINAHGLAGTALDHYKENEHNNIDRNALVSLSQAVAFNNDILVDSIRQIQYTEPSFTQEDINRWTSEGRISESNKKFFTVLSTANKSIQPTANASAD